MATPEMVRYEAAQWPFHAAVRVQESVEYVLRSKSRCSVMLTGGRSAERLYRAWKTMPGFESLRSVDFYFGDERCVPPDSTDSNYGMVMRTLFAGGVPGDCTVLRMEGDAQDQMGAARHYESSLPKVIDVLLLGVGEDGHVASLFPGSTALEERSHAVLPVTAPKPPAERLTITPRVIAAAQHIFVLAPGRRKAGVLSEALTSPRDSSAMPMRLALRAEWLVDQPVPSVVQVHHTNQKDVGSNV